MRSWILISVALVIIGSGVITALVTHQSTALLPGQQTPRFTTPVPSTSSGNPLLTADAGQLNKWLTRGLCGGELYFSTEPSWGNNKYARSCIQTVIDEVKANTGIELTAAQVTDPAVKTHVQRVLGAH